MNILKTIVILLLAYTLSACGGGGDGGGSNDGINDTTNTDTGNNGSQETDNGSGAGGDTENDTTGNPVTGFTLACETSVDNKLVGCWVTPCAEMDAINHIYSRQMVSFHSNGSIDKSTVSHLNASSCESVNPIEVKDLYIRTFTVGNTVTTSSGTTAKDLNSTQAYPGLTTITQRFTIYQVVSNGVDNLCFPDADYNWDTASHPGVIFGTSNPGLRANDIDFVNCLERVPPII